METAYTSVQTIAEILIDRLEPAQRDSGMYDMEDVCEEVRNAFAGVLWDIHMMNMQDGDRTALESMLGQKYYAATPLTTEILLTGAVVIDLPRDAGVYAVTATDEDKLPLGVPLTKTNPAMAAAPASRMNPGNRYYRVGRKMYFPDGLPDCTAFILVVYYGFDASDTASEIIPRDYADKVRGRVWEALFPSKQVRADITNNQNPNE